MPAGTATAARGAGSRQAPAAMPAVPFMDATYEYSEIISSTVLTLGATAQDLGMTMITPGGFLRGVSIYVTSTGGVLGTGVASADNPWSIFNYITIESIDGTPIIYPLTGYQMYLATRFTRPWDGDPALDPNFTSGINPQFRLRIFTESRATLGVLPNTDARAQYRLRMSVNPLSGTNPELALLTTLGTATTPTVTISVALETYAQPPKATLGGAPIQQVPDGLAVQRFLSREVFGGMGTGNNTTRSTRVGNLIRSNLLVFRDTNGLRTDLTADPIRERVDNTQLFVENRTRRDYVMFVYFQMYTAPGVSASVRPTGVYVYPRWQMPGDMRGVGWLETSEATFHQFETNGAAAAGSLTIITEDLAPVSDLPAYLENI